MKKNFILLLLILIFGCENRPEVERHIILPECTEVKVWQCRDSRLCFADEDCGSKLENIIDMQQKIEKDILDIQ